ncbi:MAG: HypC/HybG/HupF family hydrogenase formation chaperone [Actinomycetota bacterium]|jgi:hydrogenase expression/formation protein HypC|nr:HypC/HybG/HupF family hydrogenase formation chaperone [Actinomycetota bacterium]
MCLAIPARITKLEESQMAEVDILGVSRHVSLAMVPEAKLDDYALIHAGFAIQVVDEAYALETLEILKSVDGLLAAEAELLEGEAS